MKKFFEYSIAGLGIGQAIYLSQLFIFGISGQTSQQMLVVAVCSALMGLSALIYEQRTWSDFVKTSIHFLVILGLVAIMRQLNGWVTWDDIPGFLLTFIGIYLLIWSIFYLINRKQVDKINQKLKTNRQ